MTLAIYKKSFLNILFISGQAMAINEIKDHLRTSPRLEYHVEHRPDFFGSADLLEEGNTQVDVILLDMELFGSERSREIFQRMLEMAHGIPIIVYTADADHDMADLAIAEGAAGSLTRGDFGQDALKFHDVVEFAALHAEATAQAAHSFADALSRRGEAELLHAVKEISQALKSVDLKNAILVPPVVL